MGFEIIFAAPGPAKREFHGITHTFRIRGIFGALIEGHNDVRAETDLRLHRALGSEKMRGAVEMRTKRHAFFGDFAEFVQTKNLKTSGVGEDGARPCHETVESA